MNVENFVDTLHEGWAPSAYLERMDNQGKFSFTPMQRNGSSSSMTPPNIESILSSNKTTLNSFTSDDSPNLHDFGTRELEKITNDIVTALR